MGSSTSTLSKVFENSEDKEFIDKAFKAYDKDKNGIIEPNEFELFVNDAVKYFAHKYPNAKVKDYFGPTFTYITFGDCVKEKEDSIYYKKLIKIFGLTLLNMIDKNGDGNITIDEWNEINWSLIFNDLNYSWKEQRAKFFQTIINTNWNLANGVFKGKGSAFETEIIESGDLGIDEDLNIVMNLTRKNIQCELIGVIDQFEEKLACESNEFILEGSISEDIERNDLNKLILMGEVKFKNKGKPKFYYLAFSKVH
ncbi:hypothetical protein ABK040_001723 [Willaertia magna]